MKNSSTKHVLQQLNSENLPLLFVTAYHQEAKPLLECFPGLKEKTDSSFRLYGQTAVPLNLLETGPALQDKTDLLLEIFKKLRPSLIINFGICGALDDHIPLYQAFYVESVHLSGTGQSRVIHLPDTVPRTLLKKFPSAELLTVYQPVLKIKEKENLQKRYGCQLVDMEGYFIIRAAQQLSIPCIVLKLVSDHADENALGMVKSNMKKWQKHISDMLDYLLGLL